jgi:hypothetical protein
MAIIFQEFSGIPWPSVVFFGGQTVLILIALIYFAIRAMPTFEKLRIREFDVRENESKTQGQIATALVQIADSLNKNSETIKEVAIEQRRATEAVKLLQRVNADSANLQSQAFAILEDRVNRLERDRTHVGPEETRTEAH